MSAELGTKASEGDADTDAVLFTNAKVRGKVCVGTLGGGLGSSASITSTLANACNGSCQHSICASRGTKLEHLPSKSNTCNDGGMRKVDGRPIESMPVMPWSEFQLRLEIAKSGDGKAMQRLLESQGSVDGASASCVAPRSSLERSTSTHISHVDSDSSEANSANPRCANLVTDSTKEIMIFAVTRSMVESMADATALEGLLQSLLALTVEETSREVIGQTGGLQAILKCLERYPTNDAVQTAGLRLLSSLCIESPTNREVTWKCQGIEILFTLLKRYEHGKSRVVEHSLHAIYECCKECENAKTTAGVYGGIPTTLLAMKHHHSEAGVQMHGLRVLEVLSRDNPGNMSIMREHHALDVILAAMRGNNTCPFTHELATDVLGILLRDQEETQIILGAKGGVVDVVRALRLAAGSSQFTISACVCLRYLAFEKENRRRIAACNGVQVIVNAAEQMKASTAEAVTSVLLALGNAIFDESDNKSAASKNGGVSTLVSIMAIHEDDVEVVECVCRALRNISDGRLSTKKLCYKQGAVAAVAAAMKNNVDAAGIQEHGAAMLINMLNGFPFAVRAAKLEQHLALIADLHSLYEPAFIQVDHLAAELERREMSSISTMILGRHATNRTERSSAFSSSSGGNKNAPLTLQGVTRTLSSTGADASFGRQQSRVTATATETVSRLSSFDSTTKQRLSVSRQSSVGTANASDYGAVLFTAVEPEITDDMIEY
jgi:hypothetical protein